MKDLHHLRSILSKCSNSEYNFPSVSNIEVAEEEIMRNIAKLTYFTGKNRLRKAPIKNRFVLLVCAIFEILTVQYGHCSLMLLVVPSSF